MDFTEIKGTLESLGYGVSCFDTAADATDYLDEKIHGKTVGFGGSVTLEQMGLYDRLSLNNEVFYHNRLPGGKTKRDVYHDAKDTQIYISSVNGLAQTGEIINIDGNGNRIASILFGHEEVYFVIGENKISKDYDSALWRVRNIAAPKNAQRIKAKTPCAEKADKCYNCSSPGRICRTLSVMWGPPLRSNFEIILVHEELGF
ncbi:MAG: lactate utilization protein [Selenomonadaceae bacterium]|nr:lactate utilization protein [Selenomonadaceae bacterium]